MPEEEVYQWLQVMQDVREELEIDSGNLASAGRAALRLGQDKLGKELLDMSTNLLRQASRIDWAISWKCKDDLRQAHDLNGTMLKGILSGLEIGKRGE